MKIIYADGSSLGNPGKGGFAFLIIDVTRGLVWEGGGREENTTNNRMELNALIAALSKLTESKFVDEVEIRLDSEYVLKGATIWSKNWVKNNWRTSTKKDVANREEWAQILELLGRVEDRGFKLKWKHVYGHTGEKHNERVDEIAKTFAAGKLPNLRQGDKIKDI